MSSWTSQPGFPIIHVTRNYSNRTVRLEQKRFSFYKTRLDEKNQTWYIPVNFATRSNPDFNKTVPDVWLKDPSINIEVAAESDDWLILNKQQTGKTIIFINFLNNLYNSKFLIQIYQINSTQQVIIG